MNDKNLIEKIRQLPDIDPPADMTSRLMDTLPTRRVPGWRLFLLNATRPRTITFTPIKWAPVMAGVLILVFFMGLRNEQGSVMPEFATRPVQMTLTFRFDDPEARTVALVGTFNNWMPGDGTMVREKDTGYWICRVPVAPGRHEYAFLVNGEKILPDPNAPFSRYDGFGNFNSVIFATPVKNEKI